MATLTSPLLLLPPEIRLHIFRFVFADTLIIGTATTKTAIREKPLEGYKPKTLYKGYPIRWQIRSEALHLSKQLRQEALKVYSIELLVDQSCAQDSGFYLSLTSFIRNHVIDLQLPAGDFSVEKLQNAFPRLKKLGLNRAGLTTEILTYKQGDNTFVFASPDKLHVLCDMRLPPFTINGDDPETILGQVLAGQHDSLIIETCRKTNPMVSYQVSQDVDRTFQIIVRNGVLLVTGQAPQATGMATPIIGIDRYKEPYMIIDWDWDTGVVVERHCLEQSLGSSDDRFMRCLTEGVCSCSPESLRKLKNTWSSFYGKLIRVRSEAEQVPA